VDLLLEALARLEGHCSTTLDIFGDGEERGALEALARKLGLQAAVRFHGFLPQAEVAQELLGADALVLPSLAECGGAVVLEAMALGLPVIATNWGGPADYVDATCGILIEPTERDRFIVDLSDAIRALALSPAKRRALGEAGREKVISMYDWERKVDRILELYARVAKRRSPGAQGTPVFSGA
jgi:glycosyltransferase involved in cell wall biosynthesis